MVEDHQIRPHLDSEISRKLKGLLSLWLDPGVGPNLASVKGPGSMSPCWQGCNPIFGM